MDIPTLDNILIGLEECGIEAARKGYAVPFPPAFQSAGKVIEQLYTLYPSDIVPYPNKFGEICVDVPVEGGGFIVYCDSSGAVNIHFVSGYIEYTVLRFDDDSKVENMFKLFLEDIRKEV